MARHWAAHRLPPGDAARRVPPHLVPVAIGWTVAGVVLGATLLVSSLLLPASLVLLTTGSAVAIAGFAVAAVLFLAGRRMGRDGTVGWDTAAALVLFGFAALLLADTSEVLTAMAELRAR